jgi:hypothetical protein
MCAVIQLGTGHSQDICPPIISVLSRTEKGHDIFFF